MTHFLLICYWLIQYIVQLIVQGKSSNCSASWCMAVRDTHTHTLAASSIPVPLSVPRFCVTRCQFGCRWGVHLLTHVSGSECVTCCVWMLDSVFLFERVQYDAGSCEFTYRRCVPHLFFVKSIKKWRVSAYRLCQHVSVCRSNLCFLKGFKGQQEVRHFLSGLDPGLRCLMTHLNGFSLPFTSLPSIFLVLSADFLSPFLWISPSFPLPAPFNLYNKA